MRHEMRPRREIEAPVWRIYGEFLFILVFFLTANSAGAPQIISDSEAGTPCNKKGGRRESKVCVCVRLQ